MRQEVKAQRQKNFNDAGRHEMQQQIISQPTAINCRAHNGQADKRADIKFDTLFLRSFVKDKRIQIIFEIG